MKETGDDACWGCSRVSPLIRRTFRSKGGNHTRASKFFFGLPSPLSRLDINNNCTICRVTWHRHPCQKSQQMIMYSSRASKSSCRSILVHQRAVRWDVSVPPWAGVVRVGCYRHVSFRLCSSRGRLLRAGGGCVQDGGVVEKNTCDE